jgi:hypothetical protein
MTELDNEQILDGLMKDNGLSIKCKFVPFSESRNKDNKYKSLNWIISLYKNDKLVLSADYMQGHGHAPAYKAPAPKLSSGKVDKWAHDRAIELECETGKIHDGFISGNPITKGDRIPTPDIKDFMYAMIADASALDHGNFEDWANDYGYSADSRSAEKIYNTCLKQALELRAGLGQDLIEKLQEAFQDY